MSPEEEMQVNADKAALANQIRQLENKVDTQQRLLQEQSTLLESVRSARDKAESESRIYKQILDDLHDKILDKNCKY